MRRPPPSTARRLGRRLGDPANRPAPSPGRVDALLALQRSAGNAAVARLLARQPAGPAPAPAPVLSGKQAWADWSYFRFNSPQRALAMAPGLVEQLTYADAIEHGGPFVAWLVQQGRTDLAARALDTMEAAWWSRYSADPATGADIQLPGAGQTAVLIGAGRDLARAGRHQEARQALTRAYLLVQMQLERATEERQKAIDEAPAEQVVAYGRPGTYAVMKGHYGRMREVLGVYPALARELRTAGKADEARRAAHEGLHLRAELQSRFTLEDPELSGDVTGRAMIAEISQVTTPRGPGLRIHGAKGDDTDVTQLPGLPRPEEVEGRHQHSSLAELGTALAGQVDLVEELRARPEIAAKFKDGDIDMSLREHRLKVWRTMYAVLQRERGAGALTALLDLMERYLKAFTVHTDYNVRDFGVSYLDSEMPEDLAGRAERDCGVYALTVAYELFLTTRGTTPALDFTLVSMPGHVMLAITVRGTPTVYVVNNAEIDGPHTGTIADIAARFVGPVFKHRFLVTPAMTAPIGGTDMKEADFKKAAWSTFLDSSSWGLNVPKGPPGEGKDALRERTQAVYQEFYDGMAAFDRLCAGLERGLAATPAQATRDELGAHLAKLESMYARAHVLFRLLLNTRWAGDEKARPGVEKRLTPHSKILFAVPSADPPHPLVRVAMGLLRYESLGGTLGTAQQELVTFFSTFSPFDQVVARYRQAGMPARF